MLYNHFKYIQDSLIAQSKIQENSGHTLHKGTPREDFIKKFLEKHLSENVSIGTGEIIDRDSKPGETRNQYDIVIYKKNFPKLDFGGDINCFFIESVLATIEVKSTLRKKDLKQSIKASINAKKLTCSNNYSLGFANNWQPSSVMNFVVAYDCSVKMETVYKWIKEIHQELAVPLPNWTETESHNAIGNTIDGIYILTKGFITLNNTPVRMVQGESFFPYTLSRNDDKSLMFLFLILLEITTPVQNTTIDSLAYLNETQIPIESDIKDL